MSDESTNHENVLPPAVAKQVAQADAIIEQLNADPENPAAMPTEPQQVTPPPPPPKPDDPPADPPAPADPPPADPPVDPPADPPAGGRRTDWKQKYNVLKGKYDAEVPRLHADLREARTQITGLTEQLNTVQATVASMQAVNTPPAEPAAPLVSQEEIDQFGPDLIDVVKRVAKEAVAPYVDEQVGKVSTTVKQVEGSVASTQKDVAESARERLYEVLDDKVPGWSTINQSPEFVAWLNEEDGLSGQLRGHVLHAAFNRNDAGRVVKIFESFQQEHAVENTDPDPATPSNETPAEETPNEEPQQNLDDLVAPGTPKTGPTGAQDESGKGRIWTQKDIDALYAAKNEFVKKRPNDELPKELADAERDLFKAQTENRIRP